MTPNSALLTDAFSLLRYACGAANHSATSSTQTLGVTGSGQSHGPARTYTGRSVMFIERAIITIAGAIATVTLAYAQSYPAKLVKLVTPFAPGGMGDLVPREIATGLTQLLGQPVIVENRSGANTIIAMHVVAKSPPDGYTLVFTSAGSL